jgi:hypothetical protein
MQTSARAAEAEAMAAQSAKRRFWAWILTGLVAGLVMALPFVRGLRMSDFMARRMGWEIRWLSEPQAVHRVRQLPRLGDAAIDLLAETLADERPSVRQAAAETLEWDTERWRSLKPEEASRRAAQLAAALRRRAPEVPGDVRPAVRTIVTDLLRWPLDRSQVNSSQIISDCEFVLASLYRADAVADVLSVRSELRRSSLADVREIAGTSASDTAVTDPAVTYATGSQMNNSFSISDAASDQDAFPLSNAASDAVSDTTTRPAAVMPQAAVPDAQAVAAPGNLPVAVRVPPAAQDGPAAPSAPRSPPAASPSLEALSDVEVIERLSDARADVVLHAAQELGKRGYSSRAITVLENLLDPAPDLRLRALNELVFVPGLDARPWLWRVSGDADVRVRRAAVSMLITTGDAQVLRRLRELEANETDAVILQIIRQARRP